MKAKQIWQADPFGVIIILIAFFIVGVFFGWGVTLFCVAKEVGFWDIDRVQNEIRLEMRKLDVERLDIEELLVALEAYGMEINGVLIRKDGRDYLKFKLGEGK